ncbi:hypothetical protein NUW54_g13992 [Trametes sanguinea]|uniref:Uncharacterized protein n=1 Tax=Trametes sanguinea TaxID=158606 RepID=A0ACC1MH07_9APHY|nr:hypothetical protein NUW54_g13992 [Trametes sanguinea]
MSECDRALQARSSTEADRRAGPSCHTVQTAVDPVPNAQPPDARIQGRNNNECVEHRPGEETAHVPHVNLTNAVQSQPRSDESFMWTPGHGRNHSFGKSALRMVRTTAATAAGVCGVAGGRRV